MHLRAVLRRLLISRDCALIANRLCEKSFTLIWMLSMHPSSSGTTRTCAASPWSWAGKATDLWSAHLRTRPEFSASTRPCPPVRAERLCPAAIFVAPDFTRYRAASKRVREIFQRHTDLIEPLSLDGAYLDV